VVERLRCGGERMGRDVCSGVVEEERKEAQGRRAAIRIDIVGWVLCFGWDHGRVLCFEIQKIDGLNADM